MVHRCFQWTNILTKGSLLSLLNFLAKIKWKTFSYEEVLLDSSFILAQQYFISLKIKLFVWDEGHCAHHTHLKAFLGVLMSCALGSGSHFCRIQSGPILYVRQFDSSNENKFFLNHRLGKGGDGRRGQNQVCKIPDSDLVVIETGEINKPVTLTHVLHLCQTSLWFPIIFA